MWAQASRGTVVTGSAVQRAARDVKEQLLSIAAEMLAADATNLRVDDGRVLSDDLVVPVGDVVKWYFTSSAERTRPRFVQLGDHARRVASDPGRGSLIGRGIDRPADFERPGARATTSPFYEVALGGAEVNVDRDTGLVSLRRYVALADAGKILAEPITAEGQLVGAAMQGLGQT